VVLIYEITGSEEFITDGKTNYPASKVININPMVDVSYLILQAIVAISICHGYNDVDEQHSSIIAYNDTI
jgi:hypothetical protein